MALAAAVHGCQAARGVRAQHTQPPAASALRAGAGAQQRTAARAKLMKEDGPRARKQSQAHPGALMGMEEELAVKRRR